METSSQKPPYTHAHVFETAIRLLVTLLLVVWCIGIIYPFVSPVLWGAIIAITIHPLFLKIRNMAGGRNLLAGVIITLLLLVLVIIPCLWLLGSFLDGVQNFATDLREHTLAIPPPNAKVSGWPIIGKPIHDAWLLASQNLESLVTNYREPLARLGTKLLNSLAGFGKNFLLFLLSLIISGIFLVKAEPSGAFTRKFAMRLAGDRGQDIVAIAGQTVKNVAKGILGVAFIQSILAGMVFAFAGVPFAGIWALLVLMLAIIQVPTAVVMIPVIIYLYSVRDPLSATLWTVLMVLISLSDNVLKPVLMGKGAPVPVLVIFLGAIGGFIFSGFVGLFTGAIILSVGYTLLFQWLEGPAGK